MSSPTKNSAQQASPNPPASHPTIPWQPESPRSPLNPAAVPFVMRPAPHLQRPPRRRTQHSPPRRSYHEPLTLDQLSSNRQDPSSSISAAQQDLANRFKDLEDERRFRLKGYQAASQAVADIKQRLAEFEDNPHSAAHPDIRATMVRDIEEGEGLRTELGNLYKVATNAIDELHAEIAAKGD